MSKIKVERFPVCIAEGCTNPVAWDQGSNYCDSCIEADRHPAKARRPEVIVRCGDNPHRTASVLRALLVEIEGEATKGRTSVLGKARVFHEGRPLDQECRCGEELCSVCGASASDCPVCGKSKGFVGESVCLEKRLNPECPVCGTPNDKTCAQHGE